MKNYYNPRTIWRVTIALLDMFNDMYIERYINSDYYNPLGSYERYTETSSTNAWLSAHAVDIRKVVKVPLLFGLVDKPQQTVLKRMKQESDPLYNYYMTMPRMGMNMMGINFAPDRAKSLNDERFWLDDALDLSDVNSLKTDFEPTPYDYSFTLNIRSESMEDLSQILQNILPYFSPKNYIRVKEFNFLNVERDLPVSLEGVNLDFPTDMTEDTMRQVNATLDFRVEGWQYKPVSIGKLVQRIDSQYFTQQYQYIANVDTSASSSDLSATGPLNVAQSMFTTQGFSAADAVPTSGWDVSGYNVDTDVYWTQTKTLTGDS